MIVFEGNVPPAIEQCAPLRAWLNGAPDATRHAVDARPVWIGEPVAIAAPVSIDFRRSGGQNLLIVGQESGQADSILASMVISWCGGQAQGANSSRVEFVHDGADRGVREQWRETFPAGRVSGLTQHDPATADQLILTLAEEMAARESGAATDSSEVLLVLRNIGQFRQLRREDDDFGLGGFGAPKPVTASGQLGELIRRGPLVGIHVVIWADTFSNAMRGLSTSLLREFDNRIAFRLNQTDSASLIDTPAAAALTPGRAILYRDQTGSADRFRPFQWPGADWLRIVPAAATDSDAAAFNIDELTIE
jgi:hypothetical protein